MRPAGIGHIGRNVEVAPVFAGRAGIVMTRGVAALTLLGITVDTRPRSADPGLALA